ncbi:hypothetical protein NDU88_006377 [Pleurodeles waltl]|uniref:Uncharacterized protein n=1 Tax=Pleurodeles waltl TaxID=8319 RepID=A0AAV7N3V9_PLEWA|nr:hypothetical protein NDU88_006377 [Pleurodeles waltl]
MNMSPFKRKGWTRPSTAIDGSVPEPPASKDATGVQCCFSLATNASRLRTLLSRHVRTPLGRTRRGSPSAFSLSRMPVLQAPHETGILSVFVVEAGQRLTPPLPITGRRTALRTPPDHGQRKTTGIR